MVSVFQQGEQNRGDRRHARRADQGLLAFLQKRDRCAELVSVGIGRAVVVVSAALVREQIIVHVVQDVRARRIDRRGLGVFDDALRCGSLIENLRVPFVGHVSPPFRMIAVPIC